jgi:F-type H+-transporting ATPase subunit a
MISFDETYQDKIAHMFDWSMDAPLYSSLLVMLILLILGIVIGVWATIAYKKKEYLKRPKGILFLAEEYEGFCEKFTLDDMGSSSLSWAGFFWTLFAYLFIAFNWGLTGLPTIIDWLAAPLSLSLVMFLLVQVTALRFQHFHYFHRYIEPFKIWFPINLITMWSPIISTTVRMFGNCLAGTIVIGLVQWTLSLASNSLLSFFHVSSTLGPSVYWNQFPYWSGIFFAPFAMGVLNLYFSLFSGFVQTVVFGSLTALWIAQERPADVAPALSGAPRLETKTATE